MGMEINLNKSIGIFEQIKNTSGKNGKELILKHHESEIVFKEMLKFLYNPYIVTGLKSKKLNKQIQGQKPTKDFENIYELIVYLKSNNTGKDTDIVNVMNYINRFEDNETVYKFLIQFVTKEYKCGITSSTINKVYGKDFIPEHEVILAKKWETEQHKINGKFIVTTKLDGLRATAFKENGTVKIYARSGIQLLGLVEIEQALMMNDFPDNRVYDGELLNVNVDNLPSKDLFRATQSNIRKDGEKTGVEFHVYDTLPIEEFRDGVSKDNALSRKLAIESYILKYRANKTTEHDVIVKVPILYIGKDKGKVQELLQQAILHKQEGVMINVADSPYECKRTSNLLKAKEFNTVDLIICGFEEGQGKNEGTLGAIIVDYKGYSLKVGSGFTDSERKVIWENREKFLLKIAEIQYFEESSNEKGELSLRFPVFVQIRWDKNDISYN